jgi:hypothetical protein
MAEPSKGTTLTGRLRAAVPLMFGGVTGILLVRIVPSDDLARFLLQLLVALFVYVSCHEAGHALAAVHQGFRILTFSVWPLAWQLRAGKWHVKFVGVPRALGYVAAVPADATNLRHRMLVYVAGGPVASLITAVLAGTAIQVASRPWLVDELKVIAYLATASFLAGLFPYRGKLFFNDAARFWMLWNGKAEAERFSCLLLLSSASRNGVRPRDLNPELVDRLSGGPADGTVDWLGSALIRYNVLIDSGRVDDAYNALQQILNADLDARVREILNLQAAWLEARFRRDLEAACAWMKLTPGRGRPDDGYQNTLARAKAAIAFLEHRYEDAEAAARLSLRHLAKIDDLGAATVIRERTEELLAEINAAKRQ